MQRTYRINTILVLIALCATAWMLALPQSATAMPSSQGSATATIQGTVFKPDGSPAIGATGFIILVNLSANLTDNVAIDPDTATFEIDVAPGTWQLEYGIHVDDGENAYMLFQAPWETNLVVVSVEDGQAATNDITLKAADSMLRGLVLDPDGAPVSGGTVLVASGAMGMVLPVEIVDGVFETDLLSGEEYTVLIDLDSGADTYSDSFEEIRWGRPADYKITMPANDTAEIELQMRLLDASITGTVYRREMSSQNSEEFQLVPAQYAWVIAHGPSGERFETWTGENGQFTLPVTGGQTYSIFSFWQGSGAWYISPHPDPTIFVAEPQEYEIDLTLSENSYSATADMEQTSNPVATLSGLLSLRDADRGSANGATNNGTSDNASESQTGNIMYFLPVLAIQ